MFVDFKGYVDFFHLQDCVSPDYSKVKMWLGEPVFTYCPLPQTVDLYFSWIENNLNFVKKRNQRIQEAYQNKNETY
ncbi:MAG: DUF6994 family protein [Oscillospiraceae bacterium]